MDEIDRKLVSQLQIDGRTTLKRLSEITGLTSMGIRKRLGAMQRRSLIRISGLLNVDALTLHGALVMLEVEAAAMDRIIDRFRSCPRVVSLFTTLGGYNLTALIMAGDHDTLKSVSLEKCSLRSQEGVRRSEFYPIGSFLLSSFLPIREQLVLRKGKKAPCGIRCGSCDKYIAGKCEACPATSHYRGPL